MKDLRKCIHVNVNVCEMCFLLRLPGIHGIREPRDIGRSSKPQCPPGSGAHQCKPRARTHANHRPQIPIKEPPSPSETSSNTLWVISKNHKVGNYPTPRGQERDRREYVITHRGGTNDVENVSTPRRRTIRVMLFAAPLDP